MKKTPYRSIIAASLICTIILELLAFYSIGVIDRSNYRHAAAERVKTICTALDSNDKKTSDVMNQVYDDYKSKARVVAMMLSKSTGIMSDEASFEELRMAIGANIISVTDNKGVIEYSTDLSGEKKTACDEFFNAINEKYFSDALIRTSSGETTIIAGSSRLDENGIVQIEFSPDALDELADYTNITKNITDSPLFISGCTAIIDTTTHRYISHTNKTFTGSAVQFPTKKFKGEKGWFKSKYNGEDALIQYRYDGTDRIVIGIIPYSEINLRRNAVLKWIIIVCIILTLIITLSVRQRIIKEKQKNE